MRLYLICFCFVSMTGRKRKFECIATVDHSASLVIGQKAKFHPVTNPHIPTAYFKFATYEAIKTRIKDTRLLTGSVLTDKVINRSKGLGYATIARENKPLKQLTSSNGGKSAGRNSSGRITIFHRGGGAKRLHRKIDLKRSTSSMGVVERIEYNPNRSTRIALVRWKGGAQQRKPDTAQDLAPPSTIDKQRTRNICIYSNNTNSKISRIKKTN